MRALACPTASAHASIIIVVVVMAMLDDALTHVVMITMVPADAHVIMVAVTLDLDVLMSVMPPWAILIILGRGDDGGKAYSGCQSCDDKGFHRHTFQRSDLSVPSLC